MTYQIEFLKFFIKQITFIILFNLIAIDFVYISYIKI